MTGATADQDLIALMARLRSEHQPFVLATVVRTAEATSAKAGAKAVVLQSGEVEGWIGGSCAQGAVRRTALQALQDGQARLISIQPKDALEAGGLSPGDAVAGVAFHRSLCPSGGTLDVFIEPMLPAPVLVICGQSPVARALADMAPRIGFAVERPADPLALTGGGDDHFVVVATQGRRDFESLEAALKTTMSYVSFVGSRRKMAALRERLMKSGIPASRCDGVRAPAGLDIGAIAPEEIALSILAEIVKDRRKGVRDQPSPRN